MTSTDLPDRPPRDGASAAPATPTLPIGYVPGVMPDKWFRRWRDRRHTPRIEPVTVAAADWQHALDAQHVAACFVRLNWNETDPGLQQIRETYRAIALYEELQVAVFDKDHVLTVLDSLTTTDLHEESTPQAHADIDQAEMAVQLTAAGVGPVILPMSVARLHARRDVTFRTVTDLPTVPVVLVWPQGLPEETEQAIQTFVGIVRGRKEGSGREQAPSAGRTPGKTKAAPAHKPRTSKGTTGTGPSKSRMQKGKKAGWATSTSKPGKAVKPGKTKRRGR